MTVIASDRKLFVVSGRVPGDDDDTAVVVEAMSELDANSKFEGYMLQDLSDDEIDDIIEAYKEAIYLISCYELTEEVIIR